MLSIGEISVILNRQFIKQIDFCPLCILLYDFFCLYLKLTGSWSCYRWQRIISVAIKLLMRKLVLITVFEC